MEQWDTDDDVLALSRSGPRLLPPMKSGVERAIRHAVEQERQHIASILRQRNVFEWPIREILEHQIDPPSGL